MNMRLIAKAPLEYLDEVGRAYAAYWFPATGPLAAMNSPVLRWSWVLLHLIVLAVFFLQVTVAIGVAALEFKTTSGVVSSVLSLPVVAYLLAGGIFLYTLLLSCFLDIGEPRQRRPTDVLIVFMCFVGAHLWRSRRACPP
jgi:hypothetical protein